MKITYIGVLQAITVDQWEITVEQGDTIDVADDDEALVALEQTDNWEPGDDEAQAKYDAFLEWVEAMHTADDVTDQEPAERAVEPVAAGGVVDSGAPAGPTETTDESTTNEAADAAKDGE